MRAARSIDSRYRANGPRPTFFDLAPDFFLLGFFFLVTFGSSPVWTVATTESRRSLLGGGQGMLESPSILCALDRVV